MANLKYFLIVFSIFICLNCFAQLNGTSMRNLDDDIAKQDPRRWGELLKSYTSYPPHEGSFDIDRLAFDGPITDALIHVRELCTKNQKETNPTQCNHINLSTLAYIFSSYGNYQNNIYRESILVGGTALMIELLLGPLFVQYYYQNKRPTGRLTLVAIGLPFFAALSRWMVMTSQNNINLLLDNFYNDIFLNDPCGAIKHYCPQSFFKPNHYELCKANTDDYSQNIDLQNCNFRPSLQLYDELELGLIKLKHQAREHDVKSSKIVKDLQNYNQFGELLPYEYRYSLITDKSSDAVILEIDTSAIAKQHNLQKLIAFYKPDNQKKLMAYQYLVIKSGINETTNTFTHAFRLSGTTDWHYSTDLTFIPYFVQQMLEIHPDTHLAIFSQ